MEVHSISAYVLTTFGGLKRPKRRIETDCVGNAAVKIYRRTRTVDGNRYPTFEVCDHTGGRRRLRSFADHQAAKREARRVGEGAGPSSEDGSTVGLLGDRPDCYRLWAPEKPAGRMAVFASGAGASAKQAIGPPAVLGARTRPR